MIPGCSTNDKVIVITGGNRGIGWEAVKSMLPLGYHIIVGEIDVVSILGFGTHTHTHSSRVGLFFIISDGLKSDIPTEDGSRL